MDFIDNLAAFIGGTWLLLTCWLMVVYYKTEWKIVKRDADED
jgi:hypothetical protein